ncbi:MAG: hypothetical protein J3R72DRAFT_444950 [Linnemannia gamsii]|nr:MAG: hypothetical protein J3R72DRAFT_444950 [Linnemannia gamsii]
MVGRESHAAPKSSVDSRRRSLVVVVHLYPTVHIPSLAPHLPSTSTREKSFLSFYFGLLLIMVYSGGKIYSSAMLS